MNYLNDIIISYTIIYNRIYIIKEYLNYSLKKYSNKYICYSLILNGTIKINRYYIILNFIFNYCNYEYYMIFLFSIKNKKINSQVFLYFEKNF